MAQLYPAAAGTPGSGDSVNRLFEIKHPCLQIYSLGTK
jgi:hypothetical protein